MTSKLVNCVKSAACEYVGTDSIGKLVVVVVGSSTADLIGSVIESGIASRIHHFTPDSINTDDDGGVVVVHRGDLRNAAEFVADEKVDAVLFDVTGGFDYVASLVSSILDLANSVRLIGGIGYRIHAVQAVVDILTGIPETVSDGNVWFSRYCYSIEAYNRYRTSTDCYKKKNTTCVVYSSDGNPSDVDRLLISLKSLIKRCKTGYDVAILCPVVPYNIAAIRRCIPSGCILHELTDINYLLAAYGVFRNGWSRNWPFPVLYRLAIPIHPAFASYDKALYMDTDTIVFSGDVSKLFSVKMGQYDVFGSVDLPLSYARNPYGVLTSGVGNSAAEDMVGPDDNAFSRVRQYVNGGVLLWNIARLRSSIDEYIRKVRLFWEGECRGKYTFLDQDFVNAMLDVYPGMSSVFNKTRPDSGGCVIRHYFGKSKHLMMADAEKEGLLPVADSPTVKCDFPADPSISDIRIALSKAAPQEIVQENAPKVLLALRGTSCNYLIDSLHHGLLSVGINLDCNLYAKKMSAAATAEELRAIPNRGFSLYGKIADSKLTATPDELIVERIRSHYYDAVIFGSGEPTPFFDDVIKHYDRKNIGFIDGSDGSGIMKGNYVGKMVYFKRELVAGSSTLDLVLPMSYAVPACLFNSRIGNKLRDFAYQVPGSAGKCGGTPYTFSDERDYYGEYAAARFAFTWKKGGYDCLRHYEIAAAGCLPVFPDIDSVPVTCMVNWPRKLQRSINDLAYRWIAGYRDSNGYDRLLSSFNSYAREHFTTVSQARYVLSSLGISAVLP